MALIVMAKRSGETSRTVIIRYRRYRLSSAGAHQDPAGPRAAARALPAGGGTGCTAESTLGRHTCLYELHVAQGARMVDFGGWDMPVAYGSQIDEHHAVRRAAGGFGVSPMGVVAPHG